MARAWWEDFESRVAEQLAEPRRHWSVRARTLSRKLRKTHDDWHPPLALQQHPLEAPWHPPLVAAPPPEATIDRGLQSMARYASRRADALSASREARARSCGDRWMTVRCGCGPYETATDCGQPWLCDRCRRRYYGRYQRRLIATFTRLATEAQVDWRRGGCQPGQRREPYMVTLTVRHSGHAGADRERLAAGWRKLRQWLHKRIGAFPFCLLWEVTARQNADERGEPHVHAHVLVLWPWHDWAEMAQQWKRAIDDPEARAPYVTRRPDGGAAPMSAKQAAKYAAKYATKGVQLGTISPEIAADVVGAWYGKRRITVSRGFWRSPPSCCQRCHQKWRLVALPRPPAAHPAETMAALRRRADALMPRGFALGDPQGRLQVNVQN